MGGGGGWVCHCFHGKINPAWRLQGLLLDHIIERATGAAGLHKGKGNTCSTQGHEEEKRKAHKRGETEGEGAGGW